MAGNGNNIKDPNAQDPNAQDQAPQAVEPTKKLDEAPFPGGLYIVNGVKVNANGEEIDDEGTVLAKKGNK